MTGAEAVYLRGKGRTQADADMISGLIEDRRRRRMLERKGGGDEQGSNVVVTDPPNQPPTGASPRQR